ncbi:hypothetical protein BCV72DRAFT_228610 [Rhizopus microsporus var. microsporus]|uniref:Uncharacterized protein n=1 Tax=Rhizopus microsporus var. microsporus TaxID=86635 RepID=A0A1X0R2G8_RHIZD|nr:hypothetical protein BCV72DRAFT_228610 [Rhizopus microsporus var. microsporus]
MEYTTATTTAANTYQTPTSTVTTASSSSIDDDYVQNLSNELQHTKQLLKQYQIRTEQLMELVKKQTNKITDLREQLKVAQQHNQNHAPSSSNTTNVPPIS